MSAPAPAPAPSPAAAVPLTPIESALKSAGFNADTRAIMIARDKENLSFDKLESWTDDEVESLMNGLRKTLKSGSTTEYLYVSVTARENLKTICYILRHLHRTQRGIPTGQFTVANLKHWKQYRIEEDDYEDPDEFPKLAKADNATIFEFIDDFPEQLGRHTGVGGRPLSYVIRDGTQPPTATSDPLIGSAGCRYTSVRDEVIHRAKIYDHTYYTDNKRVFEILMDAIQEFEEVKVWVKAFVRRKDGRGAWTAFKSHYLGSSQLDGIAEKADQKIETLTYNGEKTRYSFETHVSNFKKAHLDLGKTGNEPDGRTKVRKFLQSIKAPELQTAVGIAKSQDRYLTDFEETVNYLRRFVSPLGSSRTIASLGKGKGPPKPPGLTYRWYQPEEFKKLPDDHKEWLIWEKNRRDKAEKGDKIKSKRQIKKLVRKEKRKLAKLKAKTAKALEESKESEGANDSD